MKRISHHLLLQLSRVFFTVMIGFSAFLVVYSLTYLNVRGLSLNWETFFTFAAICLGEALPYLSIVSLFTFLRKEKTRRERRLAQQYGFTPQVHLWAWPMLGSIVLCSLLFQFEAKPIWKAHLMNHAQTLHSTDEVGIPLAGGWYWNQQKTVWTLRDQDQSYYLIADPYPTSQNENILNSSEAEQLHMGRGSLALSLASRQAKLHFDKALWKLHPSGHLKTKRWHDLLKQNQFSEMLWRCNTALAIFPLSLLALWSDGRKHGILLMCCSLLCFCILLSETKRSSSIMYSIIPALSIWSWLILESIIAKPKRQMA